MNAEAQIEADIAQLREQIADTQDLYREVCVVLFFRHGITPTANKLYQYVRKGSMSAPAEALAKFWENLREKSRIRIEHPDLPETLKTAAGELVATLWNEAQGAAEATLASLRSEAKASIHETETRLREAEAARDAANHDSRTVKGDLNTAKAKIRELEHTLAGETATRIALESQLASTNEANAKQQQAMAEARQDFSSELEKLRSALATTEERHVAAESRALVEIDRERSNTAKLQKELDRLRVFAAELASQHKVEIRSLQNEIGNRERILGNFEGEVRGLTASRDQLALDLGNERALVLDLATKVSAAVKDSETWHKQAVAAQSELQALRLAAKTKHRKGSKPPSAKKE